MPTFICAQCGAAFTKHGDYRRHFAGEHPDQPFPAVRDLPESQGEAGVGGGAVTSDDPVNIIEETMEETPEGTPEGDSFS
jgi:hypothetical protein